MATTNLDNLVDIWEQWTDGDPVLRHAVRSMDGACTDRCALIEQVLKQLDRLMYSWTMGDFGTSAAILAAWAVLLTLADKGAAMAGLVHGIWRDAQEAHQYACAGGAPWRIG
jgi:hypothetical protein